jgi:hypothetical protein
MNAHEPSGLVKYMWTEADFTEMGWSDCIIHAISVGGHDGEQDDDRIPNGRLLLDLDYIVRWVKPVPPSPHYSYWIAPATLVFENAWDMDGGIAPSDDGLMEVYELERLPSPDDRPHPVWDFHGWNFGLSVRATGYTQYIRQQPQHTTTSPLTMAQRGGLSFAEVPFG